MAVVPPMSGLKDVTEVQAELDAASFFHNAVVMPMSLYTKDGRALSRDEHPEKKDWPR